MEDVCKQFEAIGLDGAKAAEAAKNKKLSSTLASVIEEAGCKAGAERSTGILLYALATTCPPTATKHRACIAKSIVAGLLRNDEQLQAAYKFVATVPADAAVPDKAFRDACGVGVVVSTDTISRAVDEVIQEHRDGLARERSAYPLASLMKTLRAREDLCWADKRLVKNVLDEKLGLFFASCTAQIEECKETKSAEPAGNSAVRLFAGQVAHLHKPGENPQISPEIMKKHLEATGGKVVTRFPPEPNGFLHIGHAKAINLNFKYAEAHGGICYLRYDDTNPEAEETRYYDAIKSSVEWLGFTPCKVTAASDNFDKLYEAALTLIRKGKAYVCHMTQEEITKSRGGADGKGARYNSPWRDRPVEENQSEFARMHRGEYEEGQAVLRLKQDMQSGNPFMWDLVAYRVLKAPHCRTGTAWCIYPMYDFTHCLCDSIENITHSMCTTEFINAREAYYWVCDNVGVYKAVQWEYGRLNITNTVLSKRKLTKLVDAGVIRSWDDPRVYTLAALRRRGFTPQAINSFVEEIGVTTAFSVVDVKKLESHVRDDLNRITPRRMAILDPVLVRITNWKDGNGQVEMLEMPNDPRDPAKGVSCLPFTSELYIDRSDFKAVDNDPNYFRLTPNQPVGLYRIGVFKMSRCESDAGGRVTLIEGEIDRSADAPKPRTFITWVPHAPAHNSPLKAEIRLYEPLFNSRNPDTAPGGFLADINKDSLRIIKDALVDPRLATAKVEDKFQFQRVGYFCVDPDTAAAGHLVFNLTVSIREDPHKRD